MPGEPLCAGDCFRAVLDAVARDAKRLELVGGLVGGARCGPLLDGDVVQPTDQRGERLALIVGGTCDGDPVIVAGTSEHAMGMVMGVGVARALPHAAVDRVVEDRRGQGVDGPFGLRRTDRTAHDLPTP